MIEKNFPKQKMVQFWKIQNFDNKKYFDIRGSHLNVVGNLQSTFL